MLNLSALSDENLEKKAYEAAYNGDIKFFEAFSKLTYFIDLESNVSTNYVVSSIFEIACVQEQIQLLDYFFNSKEWEPIFNKTSIVLNGASKSCKDNCLDTIKYLTNNSKVNISVNLPVSFLNAACQTGNMEIIKYILDNFEKTPNIKLALVNGSTLIDACSNNHLDVIKFLFNRPNTLSKGFKDIHKEDLFQVAYRYDYHEILSYLIFDLDIKMNKVVKKCLKENPNKDVERMFEQRALNKSLNISLSNPNNSQSQSKRNKL